MTFSPSSSLYRRKKSLKYHPDKAGEDFDAAKWQEFERARDVLSDAEARAAYDSARSAALLREAQRHAMDAKRRTMIEDLEARERGAKRPRHGDGDRVSGNNNAMPEEEKQRLIAAGRRRREERERQMREAEERDRLRELERQRQTTEPKQSPPHRPPPEYNPTTTDGRGATPTPDMPMFDAAGGDEEGDDYDARIANIERRLQERQARRAARKEAKKNKKAQGDGRRGGEVEAQAIPPTTQDPRITESKADDQKASPPVSVSSESGLRPSPAMGTRPPRVPGDFSSTMARLRAAQAAKEAKKKAEQEAAAAAGAGSSPVS